MQKNFTIQNMQTYFRNYIPCNEHRKEPITNFCTERICLKFLCPQCVESHSFTHANHPIESIKTCIKKTSDRIKYSVTELEEETNRNTFLKKGSHDEFSNKLIRQLEEVRKSLLDEINSYFNEKEAEIKKETSKYNLIQKNMDSLRKEINQALQELTILQTDLFNTNKSVKAIKKANSIDYPQMIHHFKQKINILQNESNFNIKIEMNQHKRQQFRNSLNNLVGVKSNQKNQIVKTNQMRSPQKVNNMYSSPLDEEQIVYGTAERQMINPPPLSADRLLGQGSLKIEAPNYFNGEPFLHFFDISKNNLHLVKINDIKQTEPLKWEIIPFNSNIQIPAFHRTVATQDGNIYIIGGTLSENMAKSKFIYQYDPINQAFKDSAHLIVPRSSHSIVCHNRKIYIIGGITQNDEILKKCQVFNPQKNEIKLISPCKYATMNSCVCSIGKENILKIGGTFTNGQNSDHIELYNIVANFWGQVDPTIQNVKGQFGLLSCSGWSTLNEDQVFIFGGYNQENDNEDSKTSFVIEFNKQENQFSIKYVNIKNLPIPGGFWNPQGIVHNGNIYALQNVEGQESSDCLEHQRNLIIFNGKYWSTCNSQ